jgi:sugar fermentation stimulation protein A
VKYESLLTEAILVRRYKRFLADVQFPNGKIITVHTPNTGSMLGCCTPGSRVWLRDTHNPDRKYRYSWELVEVSGGVMTGINTIQANKLVIEGIHSGTITELMGYPSIRTEVGYGKEKSRIDILLESETKPACYVEVKNVTLVNNGTAFFPDAVSKRGSKHLRELEYIVSEGHRGVILYCIQRNDAHSFSPADEIDPEYGQQLRRAIEQGVQALAYFAHVSPEEIILTDQVPILCP